MNQIQLGVLYGGEHFHRNILPIITKLNKLNLVGIHTRKSKKFKNFSKNLYKSKNKILNNKKINTIYISSPNSIHAKNIIEALKKNKNVICEKPLCLNIDEYNKIKELSLKKNKIIFEGFMFVYHDLFINVLNIIKKNEKKIKSISAKFMFPHLQENNIRYKKNLGGGAFYDCGCYLFKFLSSFVDSNKSLNKNLKFIFSKNLQIDTYGRLILKKNNISIKLEWGIGYDYFNEVVINFKNKKIVAKRFFSKNVYEKSKLNEIYKYKKKIITKTFKIQNHFKSMFLFYIKMIGNKKNKNKYLKELENYQNIYLEKTPY